MRVNVQRYEKYENLRSTIDFLKSQKHKMNYIRRRMNGKRAYLPEK